jgi:regulator of sirC expression with transglutaminase-like and TPR domain
MSRFRSVLAADASGVSLDLGEAALAFSAVLQPGLDIDHWLSELDELSASCPTPTREGVVRHLFTTHGFAGDATTYSHWHNSCLDHVIRRRVGIPISLSVLTIEVARRLGVTLSGVGMPAHFLVGDPGDPEWFLDPFGDGQVLDRHGCATLFATVAGSDHPWRDSYLDRTPPRAIVVRMLNNLMADFVRRSDRLRLALVTRLRMELPEITGEHAEAVRRLAILN